MFKAVPTSLKLNFSCTICTPLEIWTLHMFNSILQLHQLKNKYTQRNKDDMNNNSHSHWYNTLTFALYIYIYVSSINAPWVSFNSFNLDLKRPVKLSTLVPENTHAANRGTILPRIHCGPRRFGQVQVGKKLHIWCSSVSEEVALMIISIISVIYVERM